MDGKNIEPVEQSEEAFKESYQVMVESMEKSGFHFFSETYAYEEHVKRNSLTPAISAKNRTFHYLPYNFIQSKFELNS
jgi:hypothetical protein